MKPELIRLSQRYRKALRANLRTGVRANARAALALGRQAVAQRLDTLDLARLHEQAAVALEVDQARASLRQRARVFSARPSLPWSRPIAPRVTATGL